MNKKEHWFIKGKEVSQKKYERIKCENCDGTGEVLSGNPIFNLCDYINCPECEGSGKREVLNEKLS